MRPGRHEATAGDAMDDDSRRTVRFYVGGEHAIESEGMWADETPAGSYLVKNIPFFAYQVSYQAEVRSEERRVGQWGKVKMSLCLCDRNIHGNIVTCLGTH